MQYFKGDELEIKFVETGEPIISQVSGQLDLLEAGAYTCPALGNIIYDNSLSPLSNAILKSIFRETFNDLFASFVGAGTFENYISVFKKIFGDDVEVVFTVPAAGKLNIDITAAGIELSNFITRYIVDNEYFFDEIIDGVSDNIAFQTVKGFETQYELEQMLFELVPGGIYTEISLTLGA